MDKEAQEKLLANVKKMQEKFGSNLGSRLDTISEHWEQAKAEPESESKQLDLYRQVHSLAGSAGTFGFPQVGDAARHLLNAIKLWQEKNGKSDEIEILEIEKRLEEMSSLIRSI